MIVVTYSTRVSSVSCCVEIIYQFSFIESFGCVIFVVKQLLHFKIHFKLVFKYQFPTCAIARCRRSLSGGKTPEANRRLMDPAAFLDVERVAMSIASQKRQAM